MGVTFDTVICTLENMTPDHCRILDGKFLPPDAHRNCSIINEYKNDGIVRRKRKAVIISDGLRIFKYDSILKAANEMGLNQPKVSRAVSCGYLYDNNRKKWSIKLEVEE